MEIDKTDKLIEEAIALNNKKLYKEALAILHGIEPKYKESSTINGLIATAYYFAKEYLNSAAYYKKATELNPRSELASLGLFHSLWELKNYRHAYQEMERFLSSNEANNYKVTLKELYEQLSKRTPHYQKIIIEAYYRKYFQPAREAD
jgi:tetratricopeptide (TPR) repeat protein